MISPGFTTENEATDSLYDDEIVRRIIERHYEMMKEFREQEFTNKLMKAKHTRSKGYEDVKIKEGVLVYYQHQDKKSWLEPVKVFAVNGKDVFVFANGSIRKVPRCNVQLCEEEMVEDKEADRKKTEEEHKRVSVEFEDKNFGEDIEKEDVKKEDRRMTCLMMDVERRELERDKISTFWMKVECGMF